MEDTFALDDWPLENVDGFMGRTKCMIPNLKYRHRVYYDIRHADYIACTPCFVSYRCQAAPVSVTDFIERVTKSPGESVELEFFQVADLAGMLKAARKGTRVRSI